MADDHARWRALAGTSCPRCRAPMSVWAKADDTRPILYCVSHPDCPGRRPLPPPLARAWRDAHPDAGPVTRARDAALLASLGYAPRAPRAADDDDDADPPAAYQLPLL